MRELYGVAFENAGFRRTVAILRQRGASPEIARDTAQAAWARGWERLGQLKDPGRLVEWVISIALNMLRDEAMKSRRVSPLQPTGIEFTIEPDVNPRLLDLQLGLSRVGAGHREILQAMIEGRTASELAAGRASVNSLHQRMSRARRALHKSMRAA